MTAKRRTAAPRGEGILNKNSLITVGSAAALVGALWREAKPIVDKLNEVSAAQAVQSQQTASLKELVTYQLNGQNATMQSFRDDVNTRLTELSTRDETMDTRLRALEAKSANK